MEALSMVRKASLRSIVYHRIWKQLFGFQQSFTERAQCLRQAAGHRQATEIPEEAAGFWGCQLFLQMIMLPWFVRFFFKLKEIL